MKGHWVTDNALIGGTELIGLELGIIQKPANDATGSLGLGYSDNNIHNTVLDMMIKQGAISHKAFSLQLNNDKAKTGSLLFGGMDIEKFQGPLATLAIFPRTDSKGGQKYETLQVMMTSLDFDGENPASFRHPAILDSGSTLSHLPSDVFTAVLEALKSKTHELTNISCKAQTIQFVDCKARVALGASTIGFNFPGVNGTKGARIEIPLASLIEKFPKQYQENMPRLPFKDVCYLSVNLSPEIKSPAKDESEILVLGASFLRHVYVVYDLQNNLIGLAPIKINATKSKVITFGHGMKQFPVLGSAEKGKTFHTDPIG